MSKRKLCQASLMLLLGMCAGLFPPWIAAGAALVFLCCCFWWEYRQGLSSPGLGCYLLILAGVFLLGCFRGQAAEGQRQRWEMKLPPGTHVEVSGRLTGKEVKETQILYYLQVTELKTDEEQIPCSAVILYPLSDDIPIGTKVRVKGVAREPMEARNEGNYDQRQQDYSCHIACRLEHITRLSAEEPKHLWRQRFYELRRRLMIVYERHLPGEEAGVLAAMTLGDKTQLFADVKELYQLSGLAHILAVSGMHVSVLCMGLYHFLRKCGIGFGGSGLAAALAALALGVFWGNSVGTRRAVGMFLLYTLGAFLGQAYDSMTALSLMAVVLLLERPLLLCDSSFVFSFGAVTGVVVFADPLRRGLEVWCKEVDSFFANAVRSLAGSLLFCLGVWMFTLPVVAYYYYEIPVYSTLLNVLLLPFLPMLLCLGLLGGALGLFVSTKLASLFLYPCHLILYLYELAADASLHFPASRMVTGRPQLWQIAVYYLLLYVLLWRILHLSKDAKRKRTVASCCLSALLLWTIALGILSYHRAVFEIDVLDVGQGDGIFIQSREGVTFFIDGGSTDVSGVGEYRLLPFLKCRGISGIDYWFVTHGDLDHVSGLQECLASGYPVGKLVFSKYIKQNESGRKLLETARQSGVPTVYLEPGDCCGTKSLTWRCLGPGENTPAADANASSLVLRLSCNDFAALFTGDIGREQEIWLAQQGVLDEVDLLKVAHHGSDNSSAWELVSLCRPQVAVISCGKNNTYGHPHAEVLQRLADVQAAVYRTDAYGQVRMRVRNGDLSVESYR